MVPNTPGSLCLLLMALTTTTDIGLILQYSYGESRECKNRSEDADDNAYGRIGIRS